MNKGNKFHRSRVPGHTKFMTAKRANEEAAKRAEILKKKKGKNVDSIKELFNPSKK